MSIFLIEAFDVLPGIREGFLAHLPLHNPPEKESTPISSDLPGITMSFVFKKYMERTSFSRPFRYCPRASKLFGTFVPNNANAGGSAISIHKDLLPDDAVVTQVVTCQGRDHVVNIRSGGCRNLLVVNVYFEPELTLRSLRGRLHLIPPHWPLYPEDNGVITGDFNTCELRFDVWNQTFTRKELQRKRENGKSIVKSCADQEETREV